MNMVPQASTETNQVIKRQVNNTDLELVSKYYKSLQDRQKGLAFVSLFFAIFIVCYYMFIETSMDSTALSVLYAALMLIGIASILMSLKFLNTRKKISNALNQGTVIEVKGPAYRNRLVPNASAWTVGPISIMSSPRANLNMIQEGAQTTVLCLPKMGIALSINNVSLMYGARIMCPPNIETLAALEQIPLQETDKKEEINKLETELDESIEPDERLMTLKILKDKGLITEKEYENKKKKILIKI